VELDLQKAKLKFVLQLFKNYGCRVEGIRDLIVKNPARLSYLPKKTLKLKLEFFKAVDFSPADVEDLLTFGPSIFQRNVQNQLLPSYEYLMSILITTENVNSSIKRFPWLLFSDLQKNLAPNIAVLRECGVSNQRISTLLKIHPRTTTQKPDRFIEIINEVKKMGFDPCKSHFVAAIMIMSGMTKSNLEKKKEVFRKWGWLDEEILEAFKKMPNCMATSDKKLEMAMDLLVNKMGWDASEVAKCPHAVMHSLENWTIPRCLVIESLLSKGLFTDVRLKKVIHPKNNVFLKKYVAPYSAEFPELLTIFESKVVSQEPEEDKLSIDVC
jgi:mTERF domain-containing protein